VYGNADEVVGLFMGLSLATELEMVADRLGAAAAERFEHDLVPGREYSFVVEESRSTGRTPISWSVTMVEFPGGVFVANPVVPPRDRDTGGRE